MNRQLDILFVECNPSEASYQALAKDYSAIETPTWSLLLASACRAKGYGVAILDANALRLSLQQTIAQIDLIIEQENPRLICFVCYGANPNAGVTDFSAVIKTCRELKIIHPNCKTLAVGTYASSCPLDVLNYGCFDFSCYNEGVYTILDLLKTDLETDLHTVGGLGYIENGLPHLNGSARIVTNDRMDIDLPGSAYDLLPSLDLYRAHFWHAKFDHDKRTPFAAIYTSLGCKFKCLRGDTLINTIYGKIPIREIAEKYTSIPVYTYDTKKQDVVIADAFNIQKTGQKQKLLRIHFDDKTYLDCTPDHKILTFKWGNQNTEQSGVTEWYTEAQNLKPGMHIRALKEINHKVIKIEELSETDDVYCMEVPNYHCFFANNIVVHNCEFCHINILNRTSSDDNVSAANFNTMRFWSTEHIFNQFKLLYDKYGVRTIRISDELFFLNKKYYEPLLTKLKESGLGKELNFWAYTRSDSVNPRFLDLFKEAGCSFLAVGFESGNQTIRKEITKGSFTEIDIRDVRKQIADAGINLIANWIVGLPEEGHKEMQQTLELALELIPEMQNVYPCQLLPGSPLYLQAKQEGWDLPPNFEGYSFLGYETFPARTKYLTAKEVLAFRDYFWQTCMTDSAYLKNVENKFGVIARANIEEMSKIKLKRKLLGD